MRLIFPMHFQVIGPLSRWNGVYRPLPPRSQGYPIPPTSPRCACRRNWWTTSLISSTTTRELSYTRLAFRTWLGRTRSHLCKPLKIARSKLLSSNPSHLPPLCGYVKTLHFTWPEASTNPSAVLGCFYQPAPLTLALRSCELHRLREDTLRRSFAKFSCTSITTLELHEIPLARRTLLILLSLFSDTDDSTIPPSLWGKRSSILVCEETTTTSSDTFSLRASEEVSSSSSFLGSIIGVSTVLESPVPSWPRCFNSKLCRWTSSGNLGFNLP
jgi:hypothetical protein